jgi:broad specificity phosphatase PhoE
VVEGKNRDWRLEIRDFLIHLQSLFFQISFMQHYLILVRHAAVYIDPSISSHQWPLTANGRFATHRLAHQFKPYCPQHIITSEEPKAQATGAALAEVLHLPTQTASGLQEHDRRGVPFFENKADFETAVAKFFTQPDKLMFGGETAVEATTRFTNAVNQQIEENLQANLTIVAHGAVLTLFICQYNPDLDPWQFWQSLTMPCAFALTLPSCQLVQSLLIDA